MKDSAPRREIRDQRGEFLKYRADADQTSLMRRQMPKFLSIID